MQTDKFIGEVPRKRRYSGVQLYVVGVIGCSLGLAAGIMMALLFMTASCPTA